jgi:hypothetical protein
MKTRFFSLIPSADALEGTRMNSNYSTERSPTTALLFEAARTVPLPFIRQEGALPSTEILLETRCKVGCSVQEH